MWARMEDGAHVEKIMKNLFYVVDPMEEMGIRRGGIYPNLFCAHPPFQIDGNLGYSAAVAEILVQSQGKSLSFSPCAPTLLEKWGSHRVHCPRKHLRGS